MFGSQARENNELLTQMDRQLDRIYTALLVRDPGTSLSSDAYEGLRKQVVASARARTQHVAQLAEIDVALQRGVNISDLQNLVDGWLRQAGIERIEDPRMPDVWDSVPNSHEVEVEIPAYVDTEVGRLVHQGRLRERTIELGPKQNIEVVEGQSERASVPDVGSEPEVEPASNGTSFPDDATEDSAEPESILAGAPVEGTDAEIGADVPKES